MAFVSLRRWYKSIFKNISLDCNGWGMAVVEVKKVLFLSKKRNTEKCRPKLVVASNAKAKARHQLKLKLHAGTTRTTTPQQQNKQSNKNKRR